MRLILTRNGETEGNKLGILHGQIPGKLSSTGIEQAKKLALRLKGEKIDYIYSSDLARSADTAKEISKHNSNTQIEFVKDLREQNLGVFQGKTMDDLGISEKDFPTAFASPKGGESLSQLYKRAESFLHKTLQKHNNSTVLFVGHNGVNKALLASIIGSKQEDIKNQHNTGVSIFEISEGGKSKIRIFNCVKHLK